MNTTSHIERIYQCGLRDLAARRYQDAIAAFVHVIACAPDHAAAFYNRGVAHCGCKRFDLAVADLSRSIEISPTALAYRSRGVGLAKLGRHEAAVADYTVALELKPGHAKTLRNRALAYIELGDYEKALLDFDAAIAQSPKDGGLWLRRVQCLYETGDYQRAIPEALVALEHGAPPAECHLLRARAFERSDQVVQALLECDRATQADSNCIQAHVLRQALQKRVASERQATRRKTRNYGTLVSRADGEEHALYATSLKVGRKPDCDIVLKYDNVSGRHCELLLEGDNWIIVDLGSTNGTKVNGKKIRRAVVQPGSVIAFGSCEFDFLYSPAELVDVEAPTDISHRAC